MQQRFSFILSQGYFPPYHQLAHMGNIALGHFISTPNSNSAKSTPALDEKCKLYLSNKKKAAKKNAIICSVCGDSDH
eukprot:15358778-Ditylum_brightwellii.AAC.3